MAAASWSHRVLHLLLKLNNLQRGGCLPFCVQGRRVGWVRQSVAQLLSQSFNVFTLHGDPATHLELGDHLRSPQERTRAVQEVMESLQRQDAFPCLQEWRGELYDVNSLFSDPPLLSMGAGRNTSPRGPPVWSPCERLCI
ncbi:unnamed protein product [Staurois parvus]|uniref:DUF4743 domain-containing protein n=1 Tax=Staurois parvus TaxID=386267 RepID=A0ABN9F838_9NEOB|nr:unnamed protein product [Staurois parvus]